jgi:hypothetical protein
MTTDSPVEAAIADVRSYLERQRDLLLPDANALLKMRLIRSELESVQIGNLRSPVLKIAEDKLDAIIAEAFAGDRDADMFLRDFAKTALRKGHSIGPNLSMYIAWALDHAPVQGRGKKAKGYAIRDWIIFLAVFRATQHGLCATRSDAARDSGDGTAGETRPSGCSIVADELKRLGIDIRERTVEDIWGRYRRLR